MENVGIIVTARVKSNRIKNKVLQKINGKTTIEILLDHVSGDKFPVVLAIPSNSDDDELERIAIDKGIDVFRGHDQCPFSRIAECIKYYNFDHVVRITADDILIDMTLLKNQIKMHVGGNNDYTFMSKCPSGVAGEIFKASKYLEVFEKHQDENIEHVSYYFKNKCKTFEYYPPKEYQYFYRLTMDYPEDLLLLRILHSLLRDGFGTLDVINLISQNKNLLLVNHLPTVTVYTCVYNCEKYIVDTIQSILSQTFQDFEYIIIDDNSTDNTLSIVQEYLSTLDNDQRNKISVYRNKENLNLASSSNVALEKSRGKYVVRVDADDVIKPKFLEESLNYLKFNNSQAVFTAFEYVDENLNLISVENENKFLPACCIISAWVANELKYKEGLSFMDGEEFFERFKKSYNYCFCDISLWSYRQHSEQKTQTEEYKNLKEGEKK